MFCEVFWWRKKKVFLFFFSGLTTACINLKSTQFTVSGYRQDLEKADLVKAPPIDPLLTVYLALSHNPSTGAPTALPSKIFHISFRHSDTLIRLSDRAHGAGIAHLCLDHWFPRQPTGASPYWGQMSLAQVLFRLSAPKGDALSYHSLIGTTPQKTLLVSQVVAFNFGDDISRSHWFPSTVSLCVLWPNVLTNCQLNVRSGHILAYLDNWGLIAGPKEQAVTTSQQVSCLGLEICSVSSCGCLSGHRIAALSFTWGTDCIST